MNFLNLLRYHNENACQPILNWIWTEKSNVFAKGDGTFLDTKGAKADAAISVDSAPLPVS